MNWGVYKQILDERVSDAWYNWEELEKKARQAKATYEAAVASRDSYEVQLDELLKNVKEA